MEETEFLANTLAQCLPTPVGHPPPNMMRIVGVDELS